MPQAPATRVRKTPGQTQEHSSEQQDSPAPEQSGSRNAWMFFAAFGILLVLMVGFLWFTNHNKTQAAQENTYNGFEFSQAAGGLWVTRVEVSQRLYDVPFYNHPSVLEDIPVERSTADVVYARPQQLWISIDPDAGPLPVIAGVEISRLTGTKYNLFNIETRGALSRSDNKTDLPVVTCANAGPDIGVIQFVQGAQDAVVRSAKNPACVIIQYKDANSSIRAADRYGYLLLKIMP